jgi:spore coat protein U-like protein
VNIPLAKFLIGIRLHGQTDRKMKIGPVAIYGVSLLLASGIACAAPSCTISSTAINFTGVGNYDPLSSTALAGTGTLGFVCTTGVLSTGDNFTISLSTGSGTYATRTLKYGSNTLKYNLYTAVTHTTVWGNGTTGTATVTTHYAQGSSTVNVIVYGLIPALQNIVAGSYTDSIIATVTF